MHVGIFFILSALLIGFCGRKHRFGFWGYFFATLLFTPLVGLLMLISASNEKKTQDVTRSS